MLSCYELMAGKNNYRLAIPTHVLPLCKERGWWAWLKIGSTTSYSSLYSPRLRQKCRFIGGTSGELNHKCCRVNIPSSICLGFKEQKQTYSHGHIGCFDRSKNALPNVSNCIRHKVRQIIFIILFLKRHTAPKALHSLHWPNTTIRKLVLKWK